MIIKEKNSVQKKQEKKIIMVSIFFLSIIVWLCTEPINKIAQFGFWENSVKHLIAKIHHEDTNEYLFHRNNAIYLAKMYPDNKKAAIVEMDKAIATAPSIASESDVEKLYLDRAQINYFLGNYEQSLSDYMRAKDYISFTDYLPVALMFANRGNYKHAQYYCGKILNLDINAFSGFICTSYLYEKAGLPEASLKIWDFVITSEKYKAKAHVAKAYIKKRMGDEAGYEQEIANAKKINRAVDISDYVNNALHPKVLLLNPTKIK